MLKQIYLANPRGFCAGVKYAIQYVDSVAMTTPEKIYVRKEIVHNRRVVEDMKKRGILFVEELDEVPDGSTVVFSAHGVSPSVVEQARSKKLKIGDATCPLVTRVHKKAKSIRDTHQILYIGHKDHDEAIGTMGEAKMILVESEEDVVSIRDQIDPSKPLTYLMQTTLSVNDTKKIVQKISEVFPFVEHPTKDDICYATTERQEAVEQLIQAVDAVCVLGAPNSSNSLRLLHLAERTKPRSFRISDFRDLKPELLEGIVNLGITAGASSPQVLIDEVIQSLVQMFPDVQVSPLPGSREDSMNFRIPKNLIMDLTN
jgi:4-hydroxy-3-methylbut-2-enyl diphosphate reductase